MPAVSNTIDYERVSNLAFDPDNPRLPPSVDANDERSVLTWMLKDATLVELMIAIGEVGFLSGEPLLVVPNEGPGPFTVVEGNRRLAAAKLLLNPELAPVRRRVVAEAAASAETGNVPNELPVVKYAERSEILEYLGYRHITGIKPWGALEKARYLHSLIPLVQTEELDEQFRSLARMIGSRADYVARLLTALAVYNKIYEWDFFDIPGLTEEAIGFTYISTALSYRAIVDWLGLSSGADPELTGLNRDHLKLLTKWMFEKDGERQTRIGETRSLGDLSKVIAIDKARDAFIAGTNLADAVMLTGEPGRIFRASVQQAKLKLQTARDHSHLVTDFTDGDSTNLKDIALLASALRRSVDQWLDEHLLDSARQVK